MRGAQPKANERSVMTVARERTGSEASDVTGEYKSDALLAGFIFNTVNIRRITVLETRGKRQPGTDTVGR